MTDYIKNTGEPTDGTDEDDGRGKNRLNDKSDGKKLPDDKKDNENFNEKETAEAGEKIVADGLKKCNVKGNGGENASEVICNVGLREGEKYKERSGGRVYLDYLGSLKAKINRERGDNDYKNRERNDAEKGEKEVYNRERNGDDRKKKCNSRVDTEGSNIKTEIPNGKNGSSCDGKQCESRDSLNSEIRETNRDGHISFGIHNVHDDTEVDAEVSECGGFNAEAWGDVGDDGNEDFEIAPGFGILSVYCNSGLHYMV